MADVKISALPASTTPLAGTEVLPIVQGTTTKKVAVSDLTAGRNTSATQFTSTIATGTPPLVVSSTTEVANLRAATSTVADSSNAIKSNSTTGLLQVTGPAAASTRVMTTPDANFTAARTDAGQTFTGAQRFLSLIGLNNSAMLSSNTAGAFDITLSNLTLVDGSAWRRVALLIFYSGEDGNSGNSTTWLSIVNLDGLTDYSTIATVNISGTVSVAASGATSTGVTLTFSPPSTNAGTVFAVVLGGPNGTTPTLTITP